MEKNDFIKQQIDNAFNALETIDEVKVNPFFKHKVLQKLNAEKEVEVKSPILSWFTPQLQLATLGLVLLLNVSTIFYAFSSQEKNTEVSLNSFAQEYALQSKTTSILN